MKAIVPIFILLAGLSACAPEPEHVPLFDPNVDVTPGLNDKEPDTCHAANFTAFIGRPVTDLQAAAMDKEIVVMAPGALGSQEYDSARINAYVDPAGVIYRLSCG